MKRIAYVVHPPEFFVSHRLPLALKAQEEGFDVVAITVDDVAVATIRAAGIQWRPMRLHAGRMNPIRDAITIIDLFRLFRALRPDVVHNVTVKPVIYGTLAARLAGVNQVVNAISGLGYLFTGNRQILRILGTAMYRLLMRHKNMTVIVQNAEDRRFFEEKRFATSDQIVLIRGSGVDPNVFKPHRLVRPEKIVVQTSRMIADKGVREFIAAARSIRARRRDVRFQLIGSLYPTNPSAISESELRDAERAGVIEWLGHRNDVPRLLGNATVFCLASLREGLPKCLLEAAACGLPIVATDIAGCREVITNGVNGLLVPVCNEVALARAIETLLDNQELSARLGRAARESVVREFSLDTILSQQINLYG